MKRINYMNLMENHLLCLSQRIQNSVSSQTGWLLNHKIYQTRPPKGLLTGIKAVAMALQGWALK